MSVIARLDRSRACPTSALNCRNRKHPISMRSSNPGAAFEIRYQSWWLLDAPLEAGHDTHSIRLFSAVSLIGQHHLLHRIRRPALRRRVEDMDRNGAVPDDAGVLRRPRCEVGIGRRALDGISRKVEFEV